MAAVDTSKLISTTDVPPQFLKAAFLVGRVPFKALASDPRISYAIYVPAASYNDKVPKSLPLIVNIHGTRRDMSMFYYDDIIRFADETPFALLMPLFPAGLDHANDLDSYKTLRSPSLQADTALLAILDEVAQRWPGIATEKIYLMGFSGGGQFVHRMLYLYPERLAAVSIGAPGSVTALDFDSPWPIGVSNVHEMFGRKVDVEKIRQVPAQLIVGEADTEVHGGQTFSEWIKEKSGHGAEVQEPETHTTSPDGRLGLIKRLHTQWEAHGIPTDLVLIPDAGHSSELARAQVLDFFNYLLKNYFPHRDGKA